MATSAELLAYSATPTDNTLVINNYQRTIQIPPTITNLGVENDDEVLRLNFRMSRYLNETDLSTFKIRINYLNAKGEDDVYEVDDAHVVDDDIVFTWLVGPAATRYKGNVKFNVCMRIVDADLNVQREFNTTIATLPVLEGLECDEGVIEEYADILEQWKAQLFGISGTEEAKLHEKSVEEQQNIARKGAEVLATIPEDYTTTYNLANEGARTKADAIVGRAVGDTLYITDAPDDYIRGLSIFGKTTQKTTTGAQLIPYPYTDENGAAYSDNYTTTQHGLTISIRPDHSISIYGTLENEFAWFICNELSLPAGTYSYTPSSLRNAALIIQDNVSGQRYNGTFTIDKETSVRIYLYFEFTGESVYTGIYPMLNAGEAPLPYEPYSNVTPAPNPDYPQELISSGDLNSNYVTVCGKNLFSGNMAQLAFGSSQDTSYRLSVFSGTPYRSIVVPVDSTMTYSFSCGANIWGRLYIAFTEEYPKQGTRIKFTDETTGEESLGSYDYGSVTKVENIIVPSGCRYMIVYLTIDVNTYDVTNTWYQIEVGPKATEYEAPLAPQGANYSNILRGIPVSSGGNYVDSSGQHWITDEFDFIRGVHIQRIAVKTLDGSIPYQQAGTQVEGTYTAFASFNDIWINETDACMSDRYTCYPAADYRTSPLEGIYTNPGTTNCNLIIVRVNKDRLYKISHELYTALGVYMAENPVTVYAPLLTPIETPLGYGYTRNADEIKTHLQATYVYVPSDTGIELKYNIDTKTYIDNAVKSAVAEIMEAINNGSYRQD